MTGGSLYRDPRGTALHYGGSQRWIHYSERGVTAAMSWSWQYEPDGTGAPDEGSFPSQSDAESWLGEAWRVLADAGVAGVTLLHDGAKVYGPMPLSE